MGLFKRKKKDEVDERLEITPELVQDGIQGGAREAVLNELAHRIGMQLNAERHESHEYREEIIPPVITIGTDIDKVDELTGQITTKQDKWAFWLDYHGTKGRVFASEVPMFQFGHLGAILPNLRKNVYKYTYDINEKTGMVKVGEDGKPIVLKKERVHLAVELSNLKARLNLAEDGYARKQQRDVIIGGVGQVDPYKDDRLRDLLEWGFGKRKE